MSNRKNGFSGRTMILATLVGVIAGAATVLLIAYRSRGESTERMGGLSHDLKGRTSAIGTIKDVSSRVA